MSNNSCIAAEKHGMCFLRMARVNCRILLLLYHIFLEKGLDIRPDSNYNLIHMEEYPSG